MPVKVYGTDGGKNTKDATAIPDDVRAGKTFYNADGKQTGIWTPKATDYTGDADALPENVLNGKTFYNADGKQVGTYNEKTYSDFVSDSDTQPSDVASGKVFYNNEGRQVGNAEPIKILSFKSGSSYLGSIMSQYVVNDVTGFNFVSPSVTKSVYQEINLNGTIFKIKYNGKTINIGFNSNNTNNGIIVSDYNNDSPIYLMYVHNNTLYILRPNCSYEIYYV